MNKHYYLTSMALLALTVSLSACSPKTKAPEMTAEPSAVSEKTAAPASVQELEERSAAYLEEFRQGEFGYFYGEAGESLRSSVTEEELKSQWEAAASQARAFAGKQTAERTEHSDGSVDIVIESVHARYHMKTEFHYSPDETAESVRFALAPLIVEPEETEQWKEYPVELGYDPEKQLNGMLTIPKSTEHPPVAILVAGSGMQGMDSLIGAANNRPFADLAHGLAEHGIAVLRYDKRSYEYPEDVTDIETEYLWDVKDAVRLAAEDERLDADRIYLIGHSQGGMLSPKIAEDNPEFKGMISLGGTLRRMPDVMTDQHTIMTEQNEEMTEEEKAAYLDRVTADIDRIKSLTPESSDDRQEMLMGYPVSYWISLNQIDSQSIARQLEIPMLILQGGNDFQVVYEKDFALWKEVLAGKDNVEFKNYEGLSHVFMPGIREKFDSSSYDPPAVMDPQVIQDIAEWIHRR